MKAPSPVTPRPSRSGVRRALLSLPFLLAAAANPASAATVFWDPNGDGSDATYGGDGTWNATNTVWNTSATIGAGSLQAWNGVTPDSATFLRGTTGTVTVDGTQRALSISLGGSSGSFTTGTTNYTLTGGVLDFRTASSSVAINQSNGTNTIASDVHLFGAMTANGNNVQRFSTTAGTLNLANVSDISGFTGVHTLRLEGFSGAPININGNITKVGLSSGILLEIGSSGTSNTSSFALGGNNTGLAGISVVNRGTLVLNNSNALAGASSLTVANAQTGTTSALADTAQVLIGTAGVSINKNITFSTLGTDTADVRTIGGSNTTGTSTYSGTITLGAFAASGVGSALNVTAATGGTTVFGGQITDGANTVPITKVGNGIVKFTRAAGMTYDGNTLVSAGSLLVNNTSGSGTGTGAITVANGATFGGTGSVSGQITLNAGSMLSPGDQSATDLDGTSLTWNSNNTTAGMLFELGVANTDTLDLTLAFAKGSGSDFIFSLENAGDLTTGLYTLVNFGSSNFSLGDFDYTSSISGFSGNFVLNSGSLQFNVVAVPEPSTCLLLGLSVGLVVLRRRRH